MKGGDNTNRDDRRKLKKLLHDNKHPSVEEVIVPGLWSIWSGEKSSSHSHRMPIAVLQGTKEKAEEVASKLYKDPVHIEPYKTQVRPQSIVDVQIALDFIDKAPH